VADALRANDLKALESKTSTYCEEEIAFPDGAHTLLSLRLPLYDGAGNLFGVGGVSTDITERKRVERERDELLAREQEARKLAEHANRVKDEFLAMLSHELRTPLNAIVGWSEMLHRRQLDQALVARASDVIHRNAQTQAQLIEDLLDVSRIITGKLQLDVRSVELRSIVEAAVDAMRPMAEARVILLENRYDSSVYEVSGDSTRLQQIVLNLLSNAIKFTPEGGRVEVTVRQADYDAEITVSDTGQGISPEFLPHIFDRFSQADSSRVRRHSGLGLGLAIVRHLVELHGGAIEAESAGEGRGSRFIVRLPLVTRSAELSHVGSATEASEAAVIAENGKLLEHLRILLVDDHDDTRDMLATALGLSGAEIRTAATAREAFESISAWKPDVLVSDIGMPEEDGYVLIRKVRSLSAEQGGNIPALALTGYAGPEEGERAIQAGYQMHMAKPAEPTRLVNDIAGLASTSIAGQGV